MSRERAARREQREREIAAQAAERAVAAKHKARREARHQRLFGWIPRPAPAPSGSLAARKRQATGLVLAGVVAINVLVWLGSNSWALPVLVLLLSALATPILISLVSRK